MIVDTGVLVAAANSSDPDAPNCQQLLRRAQGPLVVPPLVVAEAGFLIERDLGSLPNAAIPALRMMVSL